jgi:inward rectifier potassium channel
MPSRKRNHKVSGSFNDYPSLSLWQYPWLQDWPGVHVQPMSPKRFFFPRGELRSSISSFLPDKIKCLENPRKAYKDIIYILLNMMWIHLMLVLTTIYFVCISFFGLILHFVCKNNDAWENDFDLSYHTFSTIGFGILFPVGRCANYTIIVESFFSMVLLAALTGLMFAKFSKPKARVAFSDVGVIQPYERSRKLALVVRVANATQSRIITRGVIMDASFTLHLIRLENGALRHHKLKLLQSNFVTFRMVMALTHVIDVDSPLAGLTQEVLQNADLMLQVSMTGVDSTLQDTVIERRLYTVDMLHWGFCFSEMLHYDEHSSSVSIDFDELSKIHSAPIDEEQCTHYYRDQQKKSSQHKLRRHASCPPGILCTILYRCGFYVSYRIRMTLSIQ